MSKLPINVANVNPTTKCHVSLKLLPISSRTSMCRFAGAPPTRFVNTLSWMVTASMSGTMRTRRVQAHISHSVEVIGNTRSRRAIGFWNIEHDIRLSALSGHSGSKDVSVKSIQDKQGRHGEDNEPKFQASGILFSVFTCLT